MNYDLTNWVREVADYPEPGISFKDLTPILAHPPAFRSAVDWYTQCVEESAPDVIAAIDARGFIFGAPVAYKLGLPLVLLRKAGKLPPEVVRVQYALEYGGDTGMEMRDDSVSPGQKVVVVDDLLATGGTGAAAMQLIGRLGGVVVSHVFLIELSYLSGREHLQSQNPTCIIHSNIIYE